MGRTRITGSPSGGIAETQAMLDFCARMQILPETDAIAIDGIGDAFGRMSAATCDTASAST